MRKDFYLVNILKLSLLTGIFCPAPLFAQAVDNLPEASQDADIIVTASGTEQPVEESGQAVTVITRDQIQEHRSIDEVLARTPGVTVARNGGIGQTSGVFIRGAESYQTLVLLDGVKINDPSAPQGGVDFGQLLAGNIARIEVLRGPSGTVWGSQAIGGVVNIVSEQPSEGFEARGRAEYGYRDTAQGFANIAGTSGFLEGSAGAGYLRSDGISAYDENLGATERDGYENFTANGKLRAHLGEALSVDARGYYIDGHTEFDGTPPPSFLLTDTGSFSDNQLFVGYIGVNLALLGGRFQNRLAYTYTDVKRDNFDRQDGADVPSFLSRGKLDRFEYRGRFTPVDAVTLLFGAETEKSRLDTFFPAFDPGPDRFGQRQNAVYGQAIVRPFTGLTLTGGLRYDDQEGGESETTFGGNIAYTPNGGATLLRGTYAEGFRAPSLFEKFSDFGTPSLAAERADSFDVGIEQNLLGDQAQARVTYFNRDTTNQISFDNATFTYLNIAATHAEGVEAAVQLQPTDRFDVTGQYSWIDTSNRSPGANFGNDLQRRPEETVSVSADWRSPFGIDLGAGVLVVGDSFEDAGNTNMLDGYVLADIRASYGLTDGIELFGRVENLFDEEYQTVSGYGTPGRAAYAGVRARF